MIDLAKTVACLMTVEQAVIQVRQDLWRGRSVSQSMLNKLSIARGNLERAQQALQDGLETGTLCHLTPRPEE